MFTYHINSEDKFTRVLPEGELAYDVCNELEAILTEHLELDMLLSFNMEKVSFLDCAGVGFLVKMKKLSNKRNGSFEINRLQKNVQLVLHRLTLNEFLNISKDAVSD